MTDTPKIIPIETPASPELPAVAPPVADTPPDAKSDAAPDAAK